jgi:hypothetical protein
MSCGVRFRKPVAEISDRAKRYRANTPECRPRGPKRCHWCKTRTAPQFVPDHVDGNESNTSRRNLVWACKSCNTKRGKAMAKAGKGVRTRQYNPGKIAGHEGWKKLMADKLAQKYDGLRRSGMSRDAAIAETLRDTTAGPGSIALFRKIAKNPGATNLAQYVMAAMDHSRGVHDEGGRVIHETPKAKRREFAKEIWWRRGFRNPGNPQLGSFDVVFRTDGRLVTWQRFATTVTAATASARKALADEFGAGNFSLISVKRSPADPRRNSGRPFIGPDGRVAYSGKRGTIPYRGFKIKRSGKLFKVFYPDGRQFTQKYPSEEAAYAVVDRYATGKNPDFDEELSILWHAAQRERPASRQEALRFVADAWAKNHPGERAKALKRISALTKFSRNPGASMADADASYEMFHGRGPDKIKVRSVALVDPYNEHPNLWQLGKLKSLTVGECIEKMTGREGEIPQSSNPDAWAVFMEFSETEAPDLAGEPGGDQLFIVGGNQNVDRFLTKLLAHGGKDPLDCGFVYRIEYFTRKGFDKFRPVNYWHHFGEESRVQPRLIYDRTNHRLQLAGGEYTVKREGIIN